MCLFAVTMVRISLEGTHPCRKSLDVLSCTSRKVLTLSICGMHVKRDIKRFMKKFHGEVQGSLCSDFQNPKRKSEQAKKNKFLALNVG